MLISFSIVSEFYLLCYINSSTIVFKILLRSLFPLPPPFPLQNPYCYFFVILRPCICKILISVVFFSFEKYAPFLYLFAFTNSNILLFLPLFNLSTLQKKYLPIFICFPIENIYCLSLFSRFVKYSLLYLHIYNSPLQNFYFICLLCVFPLYKIHFYLYWFLYRQLIDLPLTLLDFPLIKYSLFLSLFVSPFGKYFLIFKTSPLQHPFWKIFTPPVAISCLSFVKYFLVSVLWFLFFAKYWLLLSLYVPPS